MFSQGARLSSSGGLTLPAANSKGGEDKKCDEAKNNDETPAVVTPVINNEEKKNDEGSSTTEKKEGEGSEQKKGNPIPEGEGSLISLDGVENLSIKKRLAGWSGAEKERRAAASNSMNNILTARKASKDTDMNGEDKEESVLSRLMFTSLASSKGGAGGKSPLRNSKLDRKVRKIKAKRETIQSLRLELQKSEMVIQDLKKKQTEMEEAFDKERKQLMKQLKDLKESHEENQEERDPSASSSPAASMEVIDKEVVAVVSEAKVSDTINEEETISNINAEMPPPSSKLSMSEKRLEGMALKRTRTTPLKNSQLRQSKDDLVLHPVKRVLSDTPSSTSDGEQSSEEEEEGEDEEAQQQKFRRRRQEEEKLLKKELRKKKKEKETKTTTEEEENGKKEDKKKKKKETTTNKNPNNNRKGSEEFYASLRAGSMTNLGKSRNSHFGTQSVRTLKKSNTQDVFSLNLGASQRNWNKSSTLEIHSARSVERLSTLRNLGENRKMVLQTLREEKEKIVASPRMQDNYRMALLQREFIDTEKTYIKSLRHLIFISERAKKKKIMPIDDLVVLFPPQIQRLVEMHDDFLADLKRLDKSFNEIVDKFIPKLKVYIRYFLGHPVASTLVTKYKNDEKFNEFIQKCQRKINEEADGDDKIYIDIDSLLIAPVQRIPRYELLIRDLASCLRADTVDHKETVALLKKTMQMNDHINFEVKKFENEHRLEELDAKLTHTEEKLGAGFSLKDKFPPRWYLREGAVSIRKKLIMSGDMSLVPGSDRYLFLFDDVAIETTKSKSNFRVKRVFNISQNLDAIKQASVEDDVLCLKSTDGKEYFIRFPASDRYGWQVDFKKCQEGGFGLRRVL